MLELLDDQFTVLSVASLGTTVATNFSLLPFSSVNPCLFKLIPVTGTFTVTVPPCLLLHHPLKCSY